MDMEWIDGEERIWWGDVSSLKVESVKGDNN